jgi:hypothetical protein
MIATIDSGTASSGTGTFSTQPLYYFTIPADSGTTAATTTDQITLTTGSFYGSTGTAANTITVPVNSIYVDDTATTITDNAPATQVWVDGDLVFDGDLVLEGNEDWIPTISGNWVPRKLSPEEKLKRKIRDQLEPVLSGEDGRPFRATDRSADFSTVQQNEIVALHLLRKMLDRDRWRKYLKYGFVDVQGKSGMTYQILRGQAHVRVLKQGVKVCELCVKLRNRAMPPTDEVITRMILAECDEADLWKRANAYMTPGFSKPLAYTDAELDLVAKQAAA